MQSVHSQIIDAQKTSVNANSLYITYIIKAGVSSLIWYRSTLIDCVLRRMPLPTTATPSLNLFVWIWSNCIQQSLFPPSPPRTRWQTMRSSRLKQRRTQPSLRGARGCCRRSWIVSQDILFWATSMFFIGSLMGKYPGYVRFSWLILSHSFITSIQDWSPQFSTPLSYPKEHPQSPCQ